MNKTFADLGIPFPLFEAPVAEASEYAGSGVCAICGKRKDHCFELGIGCDVMVRCGKCGTIAGLDADDRKDGTCAKCRAVLSFPKVAGDVLACYDCLRHERAAITKDTELGMVTWEHAISGVTHGVPGLKRDDFEMVPVGDADDDEGWVGARLPREMIEELLRTPGYVTIQGESWQFCCKAPMIYVGAWSREDFTQRAPDGDGRAYFERVVQGAVRGLWEDKLHDETGVYVFRCGKCGANRGHWDLA